MDGEDLSATVVRVRAHLSEALPDMRFKVHGMRGGGSSHTRISLTRHETAELSDRATGFVARRQVDAEMDRFILYDWCPLHEVSRMPLSSDTSIDLSLHAAALDEVPKSKPPSALPNSHRRRAVAMLEYVSGVPLPESKRVMIMAISSRRLTIRWDCPGADGRDPRMPIQGRTCFVSDGDLVCFRHSGFAHQEGYSLVRWLRQP